ncbi:hypothetical protein LDENG_00026970 [Lucifuga dentata]|nr:hypothetical protein LDENG_00026970 [Lucifuga dentata]
MSSSWKLLSFQILQLLVSYRSISAKTSSATPPPVVPISLLPTEVTSVILKGESQTEKVELLKPVSLELDCTWTGNEKKLPNITGYWTKDGDEIENSRLTVLLENEQYNFKRVFNIESEQNLGSYSCIFNSQAKIDFILAVPEIDQTHDKPQISYVGDSVALVCKLKESKPKPSTWQWYKSNETDKVLIDAVAEPQRYEIKNEEVKTTLKVHNLTEADSGLYYCGAVYAINTSMSHMELKILTFTEPLKIFLAIMAEVVVLVAAILLYEKCQSKKKCSQESGMNADTANEMLQDEHNRIEESSAVRQRKV